MPLRRLLLLLCVAERAASLAVGSLARAPHARALAPACKIDVASAPPSDVRTAANADRLRRTRAHALALSLRCACLWSARRGTSAAS